jgi:hypothetical protein
MKTTKKIINSMKNTKNKRTINMGWSLFKTSLRVVGKSNFYQKNNEKWKII